MPWARKCAPSRDAARIEWSKRFAKELMDEAGVPTAPWHAYDDAAAARAALDRFIGEYEFAPGARATVKRDGDHFVIVATKTSLYLTADQAAELEPVASGEFRIRNARSDRLRFDTNGLVINPGHWPIRATRVTPTR